MDNKKHHIDPKFLDQSWHNMSELLDKEMPVQKRKKRFFWMWFLGLAAMLTLGVAYQFLTTPTQPVFPDALPDKVEKVAKIETSTNNQLTTPKDKKTTVAQKTSKPTPIPQNYNKEKQNLETNKIIITDKASSIPVEKKEFKEQQSNSLLLDNQRKVERFKDLPRASILRPKVESNYQKWLNHNIPVLPLPAFSLFHKEPSIEILPIVNPVARKTSKWRFGLYAGGLNNKLGSYRAGLHSNLTLSPKWTLHFGLGYANRNNTIDIGNEHADIVETQGAPGQNPGLPPATSGTAGNSGTSSNSGNSGGAQGSIQSDSSSILNYTKFHYFELPILFQYRFSPKWSIDFGGQIGYLHGVRYELDGESNFIKTVAAFANTNTIAQDGDSGGINDFYFAAIGGVSYNISPKITAYSNYHISTNYLTNAPSNASLAKRWQQIEVGIRYYIK